MAQLGRLEADTETPLFLGAAVISRSVSSAGRRPARYLNRQSVGLILHNTRARLGSGLRERQTQGLHQVKDSLRALELLDVSAVTVHLRFTAFLFTTQLF